MDDRTLAELGWPDLSRALADRCRLPAGRRRASARPFLSSAAEARAAPSSRSRPASASAPARSSGALRATASDRSRSTRCSSSAAMALAMESSVPSSTIPEGSTNSVWPDCEALWTMPGTAERALATMGRT
jgi:hypothetical protein